MLTSYLCGFDLVIIIYGLLVFSNQLTIKIWASRYFIYGLFIIIILLFTRDF